MESFPDLGSVSADGSGQLIYTPSVNSGTDQFLLRYCLQPDDANGGNECYFSKTVHITIEINPGNGEDTCEEDCVWPGDTNKDGVVDIADLFPIGLYMGSTGTPRLSTDPVLWCPQESEDWGIADFGVDRKHVDADGDQIISSADTAVVKANLGLSNRLRTKPANLDAFDVYLDGDIFYEPGDLVQLDIVAGNSFIVVEEVNGFIVPFPYDPTAIVPGSVFIEFDEGSWVSYDSPILSMQSESQGVAGTSLVEGAFVRTNGDPTSGYGPIGTVGFIVVEEVNGFRPNINETITLGGVDAEVLTGEGHLNSVHVEPFEITILNNPEPVQPLDTEIDEYLDEKLLAFPNPTGNNLIVHLNGQREIRRKILDTEIDEYLDEKLLAFPNPTGNNLI
ncbi:MAG: hypothetical protein AAFR14_12865, partial [Bacteroidota bacterium]